MRGEVGNRVPFFHTGEREDGKAGKWWTEGIGSLTKKSRDSRQPPAG